jgi:hypothetical protein
MGGATLPQKRFDKSAAVRLLSPIMATSDAKLTSPLSLVVDFVLVAAFFVFLFTLLRPHVPSNDPTMIAVWAGLCSVCMSSVFWLCIQMFRVVLSAQLAAKRK